MFDYLIYECTNNYTKLQQKVRLRLNSEIPLSAQPQSEYFLVSESVML